MLEESAWLRESPGTNREKVQTPHWLHPRSGSNPGLWCSEVAALPVATLFAPTALFIESDFWTIPPLLKPWLFFNVYRGFEMVQETSALHHPKDIFGCGISAGLPRNGFTCQWLSLKKKTFILIFLASLWCVFSSKHFISFVVFYLLAWPYICSLMFCHGHKLGQSVIAFLAEQKANLLSFTQFFQDHSIVRHADHPKDQPAP